MGLPPTSSKISSDTSEVTTFKFDFPNFTGTHTGTDLSLGINSVAGGGTGLATLTANNVILGNGASSPTFVAPGTNGNILTDNGTSWVSSAPTNVTSSYAQAYFSGSSSWSESSATYMDPGNTGGNTLTVRQSAGITLTAAASNVCGITFTPASSSAIYVVYAQAGLLNTGAFGTQTSIRMTDGSTVICDPAGAGSINVDEGVTITLGGIYAPATGSAVTVKLQLASPGGGGAAGIGTGKAFNDALGNSVEWTVIRIA